MMTLQRIPRSIIVLCLLGIYRTSLNAQVISLRIVDHLNSTPVPGVTCILNDSVVAVTGPDGMWKIPLTDVSTDAVRLRFQKSGYYTADTTIVIQHQGGYTADTIVLAISLIRIPLQLQRIVVTAPPLLAEEYQTYLLEAKSTRIESLILGLPGVTLVSRGPIGAEPIYRGLNHYQYEFRINEVPIAAACTDRMDPATVYIEPDILSSVGIEDGSIGGSYTNFQFNLQTVKPGPSILGSRLRLSRSFNNREWRLHTAVFGRTEKVSTVGDFTYRIAKDYRTAGGEYLHPSGFRKYNYRIDVHGKIGRNNLLRFFFLGDDGYDIGYPALPMDTRYDRMRIYAISSENTSVNQVITRVQLTLYHSRTDHYMDDWKRDAQLHMDMPGHVQISGALGDLGFQIAGFFPRLKFEIRRDEYQASMTMYPENDGAMWMPTWPKIQRNYLGVSLQMPMLVGSQSTLKPSASVTSVFEQIRDSAALFLLRGLHGDIDASRRYFLWDIRLQYEYQFRGFGFFRSTITYQQRIPHPSELYGLYLFNATDGYDYLGSPGLHPEERINCHFELGIQQRNWALIAAPFLTIFPRYIGAMLMDYDPMTIGANGVKIYQNLGSATSYGIDLYGWLKWAEYGMILFKIQGSDGFQQSGRPLPNMAPWNGTVSFRYFRPRWGIQISSEFSLPNRNVAIWSGETEDPGYAVVNVEVSSQVMKSLKVHLGIQNIFDVSYHRFSSWNDLPEMGRNIVVQFQWDVRSE